MGSSERRQDRGRAQAHRLLRELGAELQNARRSAGLSQAEVARAAGVDPSSISRLERAKWPEASLQSLAIAYSIVGHRMTARAYPIEAPLRDAAHVRLLGRLRALLPAGCPMWTEVPIARGDPRAWDAVLDTVDGPCRVEAETALHDVQALERRVALKMVDGRVDRVILLVSDTTRNRLALRAAETLLDGRFPARGRRVLRDLRAGRCPPASGIALL